MITKLYEAGILPDHCQRLELHLGLDEVIVARVDVLVTQELLDAALAVLDAGDGIAEPPVAKVDPPTYGEIKKLREANKALTAAVGSSIERSLDRMKVEPDEDAEPAPERKPGKCRSCQASIEWGELNGKPHPFDLDGASHFSTCPDAATWRKGGRTVR